MKDSKQIGTQNSCKDCQSKEQALDKCMHLIVLLKKKAAKYQNSKIKNSQSIQSNTIRSLQQTQGALKAKLLSFILNQVENKRIFIAFQTLASYSIFKKSYAHPFSLTQEPSKSQPQISLVQANQQIRERSNLKTNNLSIISMHFLPQHQMFKKNRLKNQFQLTLQNKRLQQRVRFLEQQLEDSLRRQEKQIAKKRQSLSGLVQELSEKNQIIEELKSSIRWFQSKLGAKENGVLQSMLEQDSQSLRKVVFRLENINDKLNIDLQKIKKDKAQAQASNKQMAAEIQNLKTEIKQLKQQNFDLQHEQLNVEACKKQMQFVSRKVIGKAQNIRQLQKKWSEAIRSKSHIKNTMLESTHQSKITKKGSTQCIDHNSSHLQELEQKLQSVFVYLFHIHDSSFKLGSSELFDEEEKQLLLAHRQKYLQKPHNDSFIVKKKSIEEEHGQMNPFGNSVIEAFNDLYIVKETKDKVKPLVSELQCNKLIEKISELKERNLYVRNVLISLFKSLQLRSIKKETEGILNMLTDYFQYSEDERIQIFQPKNKKLFGFI